MAQEQKFTPELCTLICEDLAKTEDGLEKVCKKHNINASTFYRNLSQWADEKEKAVMQENYTHARELQGEYMAGLIMHYAKGDHREGGEADKDAKQRNADTQRDKLIVDSLKFQASKLRPKVYGNKVDLTSEGEKIIPVDLSGIVRNFLTNKTDNEGT